MTDAFETNPVHYSYVFRVGERTDDGQRFVQLFRLSADPIDAEPVGRPIALEEDDGLFLDVDIAASVGVGEHGRVSPVLEESARERDVDSLRGMF